MVYIPEMELVENLLILKITKLVTNLGVQITSYPILHYIFLHVLCIYPHLSHSKRLLVIIKLFALTIKEPINTVVP